MKRILLMAFRNLVYAPYWMLQLFLYGREKDKHTEEEKYALLKKITVNANKGGRVKIFSTGTENLPVRDGFIMFPNHQGLFDVLALVESCDHPFSVVMKKEVANIPFLKQVFAIMKAKSLDRNDMKQGMRVIIEVTKEVMAGRNYVIFAEGTRSRKENELLDFKGGSFKAAIKARCSIVPVAIVDSYKSFDTNSIEKVTVQVHYLEPLEYAEYKDMKSTDIAIFVKKQIEDVVKRMELKNA